MKINELTLTTKKSKKRVGRGIAGGQGKTAGRGTKGQNSRSGGGVRLGFEGGQTQLAQRLPKRRGFKAVNPTNYQVVNVGDLTKIKKTTITSQILAEAGIIRDAQKLVKLLGSGEASQKLTITVQSASKSAIAKIEKVGGQVKIAPLARPKSSSKAKSSAKNEQESN